MTENADGVTRQYPVDMFPLRTGTVTVIISGKSITIFTANCSLGILDFTGAGSLIPTAGAQIVASYQYNALSDDEVQNAIDLASGDGTLIGASLAARALAGNFARFFAYAQGDKSIDKNQQSKKLLELAESLEEAFGNSIAHAGMSVDVATFDDSGTPWDGFDTAVATAMTATS